MNTPNVHPLGAFAKAKKSDSLEVPAELAGVSDEDLATLFSDLSEAFNAHYGDGETISEETYSALEPVVEGLERVKGELAARQKAADERNEAARLMASKVKELLASEDDEEEEVEEEEVEEEEEEFSTDVPDANPEGEEVAPEVEEAAEEVSEEAADAPAEAPKAAAAAKKSTLRIRKPATPSFSNASKQAPQRTQRDLISTIDTGTTKFGSDEPATLADVSSILSHRLSRMPIDAYRRAAQAGTAKSQHFGIFTLNRTKEQALSLDDMKDARTEEVVAHARDERRLAGNSLVASGGWCAPSETDYSILELEGRQGMFDLPSITVNRGGIHYTLGPSFADLYSQNAHFAFDEATDIAGTYGGPDNRKPCVKVDCPTFQEQRLEVAGLCVTAGLLQLQAYPEYIERVLRGFLVAHDHRMSALRLKRVYDGSTAITMGASKSATTPLLSAIELQAQQLRYLHRLDDSVTIEVIFPEWIKGALRADLSARDGLDTLQVTDAQIDAFLKLRGIAPQYVRNWQDLNAISADNLMGWPDAVEFLMYPAGTWVGASSDIITVNDLYDSQGLGENNYTALFSEESFLVAKMGHDSRRVKVPLKYTGSIGPREAQAFATVPAANLATTTTTTTTP